MLVINANKQRVSLIFFFFFLSKETFGFFLFDWQPCQWQRNSAHTFKSHSARDTPLSLLLSLLLLVRVRKKREEEEEEGNYYFFVAQTDVSLLFFLKPKEDEEEEKKNLSPFFSHFCFCSSLSLTLSLSLCGSKAPMRLWRRGEGGS